MNETTPENENSSTQLTLTWDGNYAEGQLDLFRFSVQKRGAKTCPWYLCEVYLTPQGPFICYESIASWPGCTPEEAVQQAMARVPAALAEVELLKGSALLERVSDVARSYSAPPIVHVQSEPRPCCTTFDTVAPPIRDASGQEACS